MTNNAPEQLAEVGVVATVFGPGFIAAVGILLALSGWALSSLIGAEAWAPVLGFLDSNAIAQTLAISYVSWSLLFSTSTLWRQYRDQKAKGTTRTIEEYLTFKAKALWSLIETPQTNQTQGSYADPKPVSTPDESSSESEDSLVASTGITSVARGVQ